MTQKPKWLEPTRSRSRMRWRRHTGRSSVKGLIGAYLIGSLAHGGFSHRYSDIDVALVTEDGLQAAVLTTLRGVAAEQNARLS